MNKKVLNYTEGHPLERMPPQKLRNLNLKTSWKNWNPWARPIWEPSRPIENNKTNNEIFVLESA